MGIFPAGQPWPSAAEVLKQPPPWCPGSCEPCTPILKGPPAPCLPAGLLLSPPPQCFISG